MIPVKLLIWSQPICLAPLLVREMCHSGQNNSQLSIKTDRKLRITNQKVTENPILTDGFIIFYRSYEDWRVMLCFFRELQVYLFLLIRLLYFVSLFIKEWIQWPVFRLFRIKLIRLNILMSLTMSYNNI